MLKVKAYFSGSAPAAVILYPALLAADALPPAAVIILYGHNDSLSDYLQWVAVPFWRKASSLVTPTLVRLVRLGDVQSSVAVVIGRRHQLLCR